MLLVEFIVNCSQNHAITSTNVYKMADSEFSTNIYESLKISIVTVIRNPKLLKFAPDHLETKEKVCKNAIE